MHSYIDLGSRVRGICGGGWVRYLSSGFGECGEKGGLRDS